MEDRFDREQSHQWCKRPMRDLLLRVRPKHNEVEYPKSHQDEKGCGKVYESLKWHAIRNANQ
jgi:hypothetical protein